MQCTRGPYPIGALEEEAAEGGVLQALVHCRDVHVGHNGGQRRIHKLGDEKLQGEAALLSTGRVMPAETTHTAVAAA